MLSPVNYLFNRLPPIVVERVQRAVGQGGFHTASLTAPDDVVLWDLGDGNQIRLCPRPTLSWVYDCGSENRTRVEDEVDVFLGKQRPKLDFLFVSHFDDDHVNGVPALLDQHAGAFIDTVVLPYMNATERLFAFARQHTSGVKTQAAGSAFLRDLIVDPAGALAPYGPRRILFVRNGQEPDDDPDFNMGGGGEDTRWKLRGPDGGRPNGRMLSGSVRGPAEAVVQDTTTIEVSLSSPAYGWHFKPHIRSVSPAVLAKFEAACIKRFGWTGTFASEIVKPGVLAGLVNSAAMASKASAAYVDAVGTKSATNKNRTSMCIWAGPDTDQALPVGSSGATAWACGGSAGAPRVLDPDEIGWLGTGDAEIKRPKWAKPFLAHYAAQVRRTFTILLPHHGSAHNFSLRLLDLEPTHCVASAWPTKPNWKHPDPMVRKAVLAHPAAFEHVTEKDAFAERFFVFLP